MPVEELNGLVGLIKNGGVVGLMALNLFVVAVGAYRGWWVPGSAYSKLEKQRDRWQALALQSLSDSDKAVALAEFFKDTALGR